MKDDPSLTSILNRCSKRINRAVNQPTYNPTKLFTEVTAAWKELIEQIGSTTK